MNLPSDPFLDLEERESPSSLAWVDAQNAKTLDTLGRTPEFKANLERMLDLFRAKDRVRFAHYEHGNFWLNFQDETHVQGQLRKLTLEQYRQGGASHEVILDFDQLSARDKTTYVYKGMTFLDPKSSRVLIHLSRGGGDAVEIREFDLAKRRFVGDGFNVPEGKTNVVPLDEDTVYIASHLKGGADDTKTKSGYARQVQIWRRGQPLAQAPKIFSVDENDLSASVSVAIDGTERRTFLFRVIDFFHTEVSVKNVDQTLSPLPVPASSSFLDARGGYTYVRLRDSEGKYPANSIVRLKLGAKDFATEAELVFTAPDSVTIESVEIRPDAVFVSLLENVRPKVLELTRDQGAWSARALPLPSMGTLSFSPRDAERDQDLSLVTATDFLVPQVQSLVDEQTFRLTPIQRAKPRYDSSNLVVEQNFAVSRDGTRVPYFVVRSKDMEFDGTTPTELYGYGGFEVPMVPFYSGAMGRLWLSKGFTFVLANIRGGGEFGPAWHQAALKTERQKSYDDFIAVAEDLIKRKFTSSKHLGISGGSNGGLLTGAVMVQRPELFNAVVIQVPLLDMIRYPLLPAGASWIGEYGDPEDPAVCAFWLRTSPYHNVQLEATYPEPLITSSTKDDRVHPGHARKMTARLQAQGHPVLFYENINGGHQGSANEEETARMTALEYSYLERRLR